jgi:cyclohexane-1-carbonyl-CoA dehydrogenase
MTGLSEEQKILLGNVKRAVKEKVAPAAAQIDKTGEFNWDIAKLFWDLGLLQIMLPEKYGGWPDSPCYTLCLCVEEIAKACASSALLLIIQAVGSYPLIYAGSELQQKKYFPMISGQRSLMGYLVTESEAGSDVAGISCKAERKGRSYFLNGHKIFATNGGVAGLYSVLARTGENELSFFLVEQGWKGVVVGKIEDKCGFRGSNTAEVMLEDVRVPEKNLVGSPGEGFTIAMADFDMSRPAVAALALGLAEGALNYAISYAKQRRTFGKALIEHQAIGFMLADSSTYIEAGRGLMERAARSFDAGEQNTKIASMAKCFCSDAAMMITTDMVQILGGYGYIRELTQIFEGANEIQRMVIVREIAKSGS